MPVDKVEIIINGTSVKEFAGIKKGENKTFLAYSIFQVVADCSKGYWRRDNVAINGQLPLCTYISNLDKFCW